MTTLSTAHPADTLPPSASSSQAALWHLAVLDGELDVATAPRLAALLIAAAAADAADGGIVIDLTQVGFCDSTGLAALVDARDHLRSAGRDLVLRNPSRTVEAMVDLFYEDDALIEAHDDRKRCWLAC